MSQHHYRLELERDSSGDVMSFVVLDDTGREHRVNSWKAQAILSPVSEILLNSDAHFSLGKDKPLLLDEHLGAHITLVLKAVKPLTRYDKTCDVARGIARMSRQEATYWYAHSMHKGGLPALRTLLAP